MATYKYLIDYFDKDLANKSWNKEKRIEYMSYDDWLSSNGYSECWSLFGKRFERRRLFTRILHKLRR